MKIQLLGVRGSTSAPGLNYVRYGGHTACAAIPRPDGRWLILDAGTGFRRVDELLKGDVLRGTLLVSHMHWDHTEGLPFLPNADRPGADVHMYIPAQEDGRAAVDVVAETMQPPSFPIRPEQLGGTWKFSNLEPGTYEMEGLEITAAEVHHKGGRTYGFRIVEGSSVIVYLPDHAFADASDELRNDAIELCRDADLLFHDSQFLDTQREIATAYAHSTISDSLELARLAHVKHLVLFHHAPNRTDAQLDDIEAQFATPNGSVTVAREDDIYEVPEAAPH